MPIKIEMVGVGSIGPRTVLNMNKDTDLFTAQEYGL